MPAVPFPLRMHACIISNWAWSFDVQKKEGQLVDSPTRIDSFILLWSSKLFWGKQFTTAALRFWVSSAIEAQLGSTCKSAIDDWSISRFHLTTAMATSSLCRIYHQAMTKNRPCLSLRSKLGGLLSRPLEMYSTLCCSFENASLWPWHPSFVHMALQFWPIVGLLNLYM